MGVYELAAQRLRYRESDGALFWLMAGTRRDLDGRRAGSVSKTDGYRYVKIAQSRVLAHRIVFYIHHGYVPDEIDHRNRNRDDNRIENLRDASRLQNSRNQTTQPREKSSKFKGVCWDKNRGKWQASTKVMGKRVYLGRYAEEKEAALAYNEYAKRYFGEYASLNEVF